MFQKISVSDVMTRNFSMTGPYTKILDCAKQMLKEKVNSLLIVDKKKLVGILTQKDILWAITKKRGLELDKVMAIDIATRKVAVIKPSADIKQAFLKMKKYGFRRLPVISNGEIKGIITLKDILSIEPSLYGIVGNLLDIREITEKRKRVQKQQTQILDTICEECGSIYDVILIEGRLLCADCREEIY